MMFILIISIVVHIVLKLSPWIFSFDKVTMENSKLDLVHYLFVFVQLSSWEEHFVALTIDTDLPDSLDAPAIA